MKFIWFLGIVGAFSGLLCYFYSANARSAESDPLDQIIVQAPDAAAIRRTLSEHAADQPPLTETQRQDLFADLFTQRFRKHDDRMAIRARFVSGKESDEEAANTGTARQNVPAATNAVHDRIKLMCPARMEPWNMDRVALAAWREAKDCLGQPYDIDIYQTFIGAKPIKVGELRLSHEKSPYALIHYSLGRSSARAGTPPPPPYEPLPRGGRPPLTLPPTTPAQIHAAHLAHP